MRHRFPAAYTTHFKIAVAFAAIFMATEISFAGTIEKMPSKVSAKFKIPKSYHEGLYYDGKDIWVNNGKNGKIWIIDPTSGSVIKEIGAAGTFTEAVTQKDKDRYIVTDWDAKKIYTARIENGEMLAEGETSVAPAHPAGAVWNGANLFVITWTRSPTGTKFHLLKMDEKFNLLSSKQITRIQEPSQLAWDGNSLWISSWYTRRIYKIDGLTQEIIGYVISPADKTTGIVWAGKDLWVTGTYSDLYKMELVN